MTAEGNEWSGLAKVAAMDQAMEALKNLARLVGHYRMHLIANGLSPEEYTPLLVAYQSALMGFQAKSKD